MGAKKSSRTKEPFTIHDRIFTEFDTQKERNIDQNIQKQGNKVPTAIPERPRFH
ncbi:MAG TPA: hypothetical protein VHQ46_01960 [Desulfobacteria bacterium]|nr:hypothetical protein [Desulfobacteria bacterium]